MADIAEVTEGTFEEKVFQAGRPVLVDFTAPWCGPCRAMAPAIAEIASEYADEAGVYLLQVDTNPKIVERYEIRVVPTFLLFRGEEIVFRATGSLSRSTITAAIEQALGEHA